MVEPEAGYSYHVRTGSISRVLELHHVGAMLDADAIFLRDHTLDAAAKAAQARRTRSLQEAAAFLTLVQHLKDAGAVQGGRRGAQRSRGVAPSQNADRGAAAAGCPLRSACGHSINRPSWRPANEPGFGRGGTTMKQDDAMRRVRKAVIPVAGLGTRFLPATKAMPKEMLTIVDRPVVQYAVDEALEAGIEHIVFVTGRNKHVIEDYFDIQPELVDTLTRSGKLEQLVSLSRLQQPAGTISFTRQQAPHGLGHAVWCARDIIGDEPFALLLPDMVSFGDKGCLAGVMDLYEQTGGNVLAVEQCDPLETQPLRHRREGRQRRQRFRRHRDGREAGAGGTRRPTISSTAATSCSPRFSRSSTRRSAAPATRSS